MCSISLDADRVLLKDTRRWRQIHDRSRQQTCFSFFIPPKFFNKPIVFLLYKTVTNNSHATRLHLVSYFLFFTRCDVIWDPLKYTRTEKM